MFGQQQNTSGFGGQQTGGIFGQKPAQASGFGGGGFGQTAQPQASAGLFGQPQAATGGAGLFGQAQPQSSGFGGGAFGGNTSQPAQSSQGLFGQPTASQGLGMGMGQQQPAQNSLFGGGASSSFGQSMGQAQPGQSQGLFGASASTSSFGGIGGQQQSGFQQSQGAFGTPAQSAFGGLGQNQNQQQKSGFFNQSQQSTGTTSAWGQPQQTQQSSGLFGQQQPAGGLMGQQPQAMGQAGAQMIYSQPQFYPQQQSTIGRPYQPKTHVADQGNQNLHFTNIRADDEFSRPSIQMLRFYDLKQSKGQPQQNYEFMAMQEFQQNQQRYPLLQKLQSILSGQTASQPTTGQAQNTSAFGQTSSFGGIGAGQTSAWGQPTMQPQQQQSTLFGQPQQSAGLFGSTAQSQSVSSGGLFGATGGQPQQQSTLFGGGQSAFGGLSASPAPTQSTGGSSLFGQQTPTQQPGQSSLFGGQQQQQPQSAFSGAGSTLFGGNQAQQQQQPQGQSSLFGQQPQASQSSLFGGQQQQQPQQQQSSLFGGAQPGQSSLFGAKPATSPTPAINVGLGLGAPAQNSFQTPGQGSSLFGAPAGQQQQNTGSSLFGAKPAGSSLFGAPQGQGQPQGLFGSTPAMGGGAPSFFGASQQQQPGQQPQQQSTLFGQPQQLGQQQQQPQNYVDLYSSKDPLGLQNSFLSRDHPMDHIQKDLEYIKKQVETKYPAPPANAPLDINVIYSQHQPSVNVTVSYKHNESQVYEEEAARQKAKQDAKYQKMLQTQQNARKDQKQVLQAAPISLYKTQQETQSFKPDLSRQRDNLSRTTTRDTIKVTFRYAHSPRDVYNNTFEIHMSRDTNDVIKKAVQWLTNEFNYDGPSADVKVFFNETQLESNKSLKDAGVQEDTVLKVCLPAAVPQVNQLVMDNDQASEELLPKAPKEGYQTSPSMERLLKMSVKELESVENFTVFNEFGSVEWVGKTDVTRVDLKDIVTIEQSNAEVYDDERHKLTKPSVGQKLNKQAIITLKNIKAKAGQSFTQKEHLLRKRIEKDGDAQHLSYDGQRCEWSFKVEHFTKWGAGEDDDEEMDSTAPQPAQAQVYKAPQITKPVLKPIAEPMFTTQQKPSPTIEVVMEDLDSAQSEKDSFYFKNQVQQKRFHQSSEATPRQQSVVIPRIETPIQDAKQIDFEHKLNKIQKRETLFKEAASAQTLTPSNSETLQYLKSIGIKKVQKTSLGKRAVPRPCFHPSGKGILFTQGKTISLKAIPAVEEFQIQDVISKHLQSHSTTQISSQLQNLSLDQDQIMYESDTKKNQFEDQFLRSIQQADLPSTQLFSNPRQINDFLTDLARHYSKQAKPTKQLSYEFYVICTLNALYGDPCRQLNQLHKKQKGPECQFKVIVGGEVGDESSLAVQKQRRNAVTEVMRLLCQQEFSVSTQLGQMVTDDQIYMTALQLLQVGDLKQAVQLLNKNKKTKLALLVSQSATNQFAMNLVKNVGGYQGAAKKIIEFISGQAKPQMQWEKNLLYALMYTECHSKPLSQIIESQSAQKNESLIWKLLTTYARLQHSDTAIHEMKGQLTPSYNSRDFRLQWVTHLVLRSALLQQKLSQTLQAKSWSCHIPDGTLTASASKYVYQLLGQDNLVEACQVTLLIPELQIRTRLLFEILMRTASTESLKAQSDVCDTLQIPQKFRLAALAIKMQAGSHCGQSVDMWVKCGNFVCAEDLFRRMVLPSYLKKQVGLSSLKQLYFEHSFMTQNMVQQPTKIDKQLMQMQSQYPKGQLQQWQVTPSGLYMRVRNVQKDFFRNNFQLLNDELNEISQLIPVSKDHLSNWLRAEVTEMLVAINQKKKTGLLTEAPILEGVPQAQAMRGCEQVMTKGLIDSSMPVM